MREELVYIQILSKGVYSDWVSPARPLRERVLHPRLIKVASLIVISLLALALWVALWDTVASLASLALR